MPKLNKKEIVQRILTVPPRQKGPFWRREYKLLNDLLEAYPNLEFWEKVNFHQEWDSLRVLKSEYGKNILDKKYREFHYILPDPKEYPLGDKCGEDRKINKKPRTVREFLS
jgi:hypothetical protein